MRALLALALALSPGCYASHERTIELTDAGPSVLEGRWLIEQPEHALYEAVVLDFERGGALREVCRVEGGPLPDAVTRESDGLSCQLTGPWSSRVPEELAIESYCDDSLQRVVVLDMVLPDPRVRKVGGEEGWSHGPAAWRWWRCAEVPERCREICD